MRLPRLSLRLQLALAAAVLTMAAVTLTARVVEHYASEALRRDVAGSLSEIAYQMRDKLDRGMFERWREIRTLAAMRSFRSDDITVGAQRAILDSMRESFPAYSWIGYVRYDGTVLASTGGMLEGADVSQREWFAGGLQGPFAGDVHEAKLLAKLIPAEGDEPLRFIDVAAPVHAVDGTLKGVLGAHMSWGWAAEVQASLLEPAAHRYRLDVMIIDRDGLVQLGPRELIGEALDPRAADRDGDERYMTATSVSEGYRDYPGLGWTVLVRQPESVAFATVEALQHRVVQVGIVIAFAAGLIGWFGATMLTRPLSALTGAVRRSGAHPTSVGVPILTNFPEVEVLSHALDTAIRAEAAQRTSLKTLNETLEARVAARTEELARMNSALSAEIDERRRVEADRERLLDELKMLAERDPLTGCVNRRGFDKLAVREVARSDRFGQRLAVLVLDIDHFKQVNDTYGHAAGDLVLAMIGASARTVLRETDVVARFGGEEFVVLLTDADEATAMAAAERLRLAIAAGAVPTIKGELRVTASIGVAEVDPSALDIDAALRLADERLYAAKRAGRNRSMRGA